MAAIVQSWSKDVVKLRLLNVSDKKDICEYKKI